MAVNSARLMQISLATRTLLRRSLMLQAHRPWMPILLIHGLEDGHVPAWQSARAYELIRDPEAQERSGLWLVPGARRLQSLEVAPAEYVRRTLDWFDRWM
jgi:dipeptidyl aminopeptidase/acylaminoacyl peptidase